VGSDLRGSFLLSQGPSGSRGGARAIWSDSSVHSDGASFHACHLADVLLHIPPQYLSARREAHQVLAGCRDFLIREFQRHEGWLVDIHGERTPLTVFGLALCRPLSISLPSQWLDIALTALGMLDSDRYGFLTRCFGVVNASYLTRTAVDADFSAKAEAYARKSLASFLGIEHFSTRPPRDIAALLRAVVHALELIDCRLLSLVLKVGVEHDQ